VVAIDADDGSVARRQHQFGNLAARTGGERIVHLIPKWSIETWILCLVGQNVDENQSYRRAPDIDEQIAPAAATFYEWSRPKATLPDLHSIAAGRHTRGPEVGVAATPQSAHRACAPCGARRRRLPGCA
jgi:hypothetical protein